MVIDGGVGIAKNLNIGGTLDVIGAVTGNSFYGELIGTINTATTAITQAVTDSSTRIATTEFVAAGTAGTVTSISDHIHFSSNNNLAATSGTEYSATASIAKGRRTFDSSSATNTYNAGITLGVNSIVTITITQKAVFGVPPKIMQILVSNIDSSNNNFEITTYSIDGAASAPNSDFTFNFLIIK